MATLKQLREEYGVTQAEIAKKTSIDRSTLCGYEAGNITPKLEDILAIDKAFNEQVEWPDTYSPELKNEINILLQYFPTVTVVNFLARWLRTDISYGAKMIKHFAQLTQKANREPLLPTSTF